MNRTAAVAVFLAGMAAVTPARAQAPAAARDVCITVDEAHDTLSSENRAAARLLLARQFELEGDRVVPEGCATPYTVSHVKLGETIVVTLSGPNGQRREGTALGLDDLPPLYSQMVRSIVTGRPMEGFNVVDRSNVTEAQTSANRVHIDSFGYARLGYGSIFGDRRYGGPTIGFGYRAELDSFGLDVSFLNYQLPSSGSGGYYGPSDSSTSGSLLKLEALYFMKPKANATMYVGGGASYGVTDFGGATGTITSYQSSWHGSGLQGELTVGYEWPRASSLRTFVQADAMFPFYNVTSQTIAYSRSGPSSVASTEHRYSPSLVVSVGLGWQRNRHR